MTSFGAIQGTLIARLGLPSFIVTLAGFLGLQGVLLELAQIDKTALGSGLSLDQTTPVYKLANDNMSPALGWIVLVVVLAAFAAMTLHKARSQAQARPGRAAARRQHPDDRRRRDRRHRSGRDLQREPRVRDSVGRAACPG